MDGWQLSGIGTLMSGLPMHHPLRSAANRSAGRAVRTGLASWPLLRTHTGLTAVPVQLQVIAAIAGFNRHADHVALSVHREP